MKDKSKKNNKSKPGFRIFQDVEPAKTTKAEKVPAPEASTDGNALSQDDLDFDMEFDPASTQITGDNSTEGQ
jgi:hypothetical protein